MSPVEEVPVYPDVVIVAADVLLVTSKSISQSLLGATNDPVPHSTLALKTKGLADATVCRDVVARFERLGVAGERLVFSPWTKTVREHMEYHREIDV